MLYAFTVVDVLNAEGLHQAWRLAALYFEGPNVALFAHLNDFEAQAAAGEVIFRLYANIRPAFPSETRALGHLIAGYMSEVNRVLTWRPAAELPETFLNGYIIIEEA